MRFKRPREDDSVPSDYGTGISVDPAAWPQFSLPMKSCGRTEGVLFPATKLKRSRTGLLNINVSTEKSTTFRIHKTMAIGGFH